jgi:hypothetical protein
MRPAGLRAGATWAWVVAALVAVAVSGCAARHHQQPSCSAGDSAIFLLEAQAVPSATLIPCILPLPGGWSHGGAEVSSGLARFWVDSDRAGAHAAEVRLTRACDVSGAAQLPASSGEARLRRYHLRRYEQPDAAPAHGTARYYLFTGGCVTYRLSFTRQAAPALFDQADQFLGLTPRSLYVGGVRDDTGLTLCGAEAPPCPG